jgi:hypothetical protein
VAIMTRFNIELILTFDAGFDGIPGIRRFEAGPAVRSDRMRRSSLIRRSPA